MKFIDNYLVTFFRLRLTDKEKALHVSLQVFLIKVTRHRYYPSRFFTLILVALVHPFTSIFCVIQICSHCGEIQINEYSSDFELFYVYSG